MRVIAIKDFVILSLFILVSFALPAVSLAQGGSTTANINGSIKDPTGAVITGANIKVENLNTKIIRETSTQDNGSFIISQLPPGDYQLTLQAEGFVTKTLPINLALGTSLLMELKLEVGASSNIVEVTAADSVTEGRTESSVNITRQGIEALPINRRNFLDFTLTTPRVVRDRAPNEGVSASSGLSFNGLSARFNNITIDGLDNNDRSTGTVRATFSQDAVQEFQVVSDSFSAEFGRALGGVVNIVTKGGGNEFHGSLFLLDRNDKTSARDPFVAVEPDYKQYQFGGTFSGPLRRDRIFFFNSFERLSIKQNNLVTISDATVQSINRVGFPITNGPQPFSLGTTSALARLDIRLNANDTLFVRYNFGGVYNGAFEPYGTLTSQTNGGFQRLDDNSIAASNTYINSRLNLVNETRFLFGPRDQRLLPNINDPQVRIQAPEGIVTIGHSSFLAQLRKTRTYQFADNVSLSRGNHQIKFGGDFTLVRAAKDDNQLPIFGNGVVLFQPIDFTALSGIPGLPSFTGIEAFDPSLRTPAQLGFLTLLSGLLPSMSPGFPANLPLANLSLPTVYAQGFGDPHIANTQKQFSLFLQDDIKLKENLLVKLGMRYDLTRINDTPKNNGNFSPRLSLSYRPTRLPKLDVHAAYGLFFGTLIFGTSTLVSDTTNPENLKITVLPFPFSILPFALPGHGFPASTTIPDGVTFTPQLSTKFTFDKNLRNSYSQQISAGFNYLINNNTQIAVTYDYVRGIKLISQRNINPVVRPVTGNPLASQLTGRLMPGQGEIFEFESGFDSFYHGVTISFNQRIHNRFNILAHYTFSKAIDNFLDARSDQQEISDPLLIANEKALSLQDIRNRFVVSGVWDLDYFNSRYLKGLQLSTIINLESGKPYNLLAGVDLNMNGDNPPGDRPANLGRNAGITPGFATVDLRITKSISIKERVRCQLIAEAFNLFNRLNISEIDRTFMPDAAGNFNLPRQENGRYIVPSERYRNAFAPRQFQFGFRVNF